MIMTTEVNNDLFSIRIAEVNGNFYFNPFDLKNVLKLLEVNEVELEGAEIKLDNGDLQKIYGVSIDYLDEMLEQSPVNPLIKELVRVAAADVIDGVSSRVINYKEGTAFFRFTAEDCRCCYLGLQKYLGLSDEEMMEAEWSPHGSEMACSFEEVAKLFKIAGKGPIKEVYFDMDDGRWIDNPNPVSRSERMAQLLEGAVEDETLSKLEQVVFASLRVLFLEVSKLQEKIK